MAITYKISEIFETLQGEGSFTGQPSVFIRLQGCPVGCSWCDTKHTWEVKPDKQIPINDLLSESEETESWSDLSVEEILALYKAQGYKAKHVVITGGEPSMYDLVPLCQALEAYGLTTQIETSGTFEVNTTVNCWVTVSPKVNMKGGYKILAQAMERANEIKHPVATEQHVDDLKALLAEFNVSHKQVYLQPISQKQRATELAIRTCIENDWRLSVQVHKYIGIE